MISPEQAMVVFHAAFPEVAVAVAAQELAAAAGRPAAAPRAAAAGLPVVWNRAGGPAADEARARARESVDEAWARAASVARALRPARG